MKRRILVLFAGGLLLVLVGTGRVFAHHSFAATYVAGKRLRGRKQRGRTIRTRPRKRGSSLTMNRW